MIAAQLLAYYFTELKDDQVKKVSASCSHVEKKEWRASVWTMLDMIFMIVQEDL